MSLARRSSAFSRLIRFNSASWSLVGPERTAPVRLGSPNPQPDRLGRWTKFLSDRTDRLPLRFVLALVIENHPHRTLTQLVGIPPPMLMMLIRHRLHPLKVWSLHETRGDSYLSLAANTPLIRRVPARAGSSNPVLDFLRCTWLRRQSASRPSHGSSKFMYSSGSNGNFSRSTGGFDNAFVSSRAFAIPVNGAPRFVARSGYFCFQIS